MNAVRNRCYPALPSTISRHDLGVLDGDTIDLQLSCGLGVYVERRVRLLGVNCPEVRRRSSAKAGERFKKLTHAFISYAVDDPTQSLEVDTGFTERNDGFGRLLADVYRVFIDADGYLIGRESLSEFLLKNGAPVYIGVTVDEELFRYGR